MIFDDEKGYVLSGIGMLLLIPLMIIIPIAISLQADSSQLPSTFVKSDTVHRTFKAIEKDIQEQTIIFTEAVYNNTYSNKTYNNSAVLAGEISKLYNNTRESNYQQTYAGVVDTVRIQPNYQPGISLNNVSGDIRMNNGINLQYTFVNNTTMAGKIVYIYKLTAILNMTIHVSKVDMSQEKRYEYPIRTVNFYVNSNTNNMDTARLNISAFFSQLETMLAPYCGGV